ncbi:MAG: dienelactone hydrolase family protein [Acidobacteria bacterium]|nr:dienelactone hydrolase family protein [Acidobacteriota bacterium]
MSRHFTLRGKDATVAVGETLMKEQDLKLAMPDGTAEAVLYKADDGKALPGVLFVPDIGSIRDAMRQMARRLADEGYTVLMPNPFYRTSATPVFPPTIKHGTQERLTRIGELSAPLTPDKLEQDLAVYLDYLIEQATTGKGTVGVVGYCIGGGIALRAAAVRANRVGAVASFHGGGLYKEGNPASPHKVLPQVKARLYFGHASEDGSMRAEDITKFEKVLKHWGGRFESETYAARHGWTVADNPAYNKPEAERAWVKLTGLFKDTLQAAMG